MKNAGNIQEGSTEYVASMQQLCETGSYKHLPVYYNWKSMDS